MALTEEQVEKLLKGLEKKQEEHLQSKNGDALVAMYHPDAILVHKGVKAYYGREEIKKTFEPIFEALGDSKIKPIKPLYASSSNDGEYLIRRATFEMGENSKDCPLEQIYKKVNGQYLIYHDEFEL